MKICVYPGSFDPPTNGHIYIVERCRELFDETIILVGTNPAKKNFFSPEERVAMWDNISHNRKWNNPARTTIQTCWFTNQYAVSWARANQAEFLVRGIRGTADLEYETAMQAINKNIEPSVQTIFIVPPPEISCVSSSAVRGMVGIFCWEDAVSPYIPNEVLVQFVKKLEKKQ